MEKELYFEDGYAFIELKNEVGMELTLSTFGAGLYSLKAFGEYMNNTPLSKKDYAESLAYYGKTVGRVAGRIKGGTLFLEGKEYPLSKNEGNGTRTLHGGKEGYSFKEWGYIEKEDSEAHYVCFYLLSEHLDNGFPYVVKPGVVYVLFKKENRFQIQLFAQGDKATPVSLTNHAYWNLGKKDILDATLHLKMKKVMHYDDELIPQGYIDPIPALDFHNPKRLGDSLYDPSIHDTPMKGVDHNFLLEGKHSHLPSIIFMNGDKKLEISTSFPSVQIYGDNYGSGTMMLNGEKDKDYSSLAIEPQLEPDLEKMLLSPKEPFAHLIDYRFSKKGE